MPESFPEITLLCILGMRFHINKIMKVPHRLVIIYKKNQFKSKFTVFNTKWYYFKWCPEIQWQNCQLSINYICTKPFHEPFWCLYDPCQLPTHIGTNVGFQLYPFCATYMNFWGFKNLDVHKTIIHTRQNPHTWKSVHDEVFLKYWA